MKNVLDSGILVNGETFFCLVKTQFSCRLVQKKNKRIIPDELYLPEGFSTFLENAVRLLNVKPDEYYLSDTENLSDSVEVAIKRFENHPIV